MSRAREEWDRRWPDRDNRLLPLYHQTPIVLACEQEGLTTERSGNSRSIPKWALRFGGLAGDGSITYGKRVTNAKRLIRQAADEERYRAMLAVLSTSGKDALWQLIEVWEAAEASEALP